MAWAYRGCGIDLRYPLDVQLRRARALEGPLCTPLKWKQGITQEQSDAALIRRAGWQYPSGVTLINECWLATENPTVVSISSADGFAALMELQMTWGDVFDVTIFPAISFEDGLKIGPVWHHATVSIPDEMWSGREGAAG